MGIGVRLGSDDDSRGKVFLAVRLTGLNLCSSRTKCQVRCRYSGEEKR